MADAELDLTKTAGDGTDQQPTSLAHPQNPAVVDTAEPAKVRDEQLGNDSDFAPDAPHDQTDQQYADDAAILASFTRADDSHVDGVDGKDAETQSFDTGLGVQSSEQGHEAQQQTQHEALDQQQSDQVMADASVAQHVGDAHADHALPVGQDGQPEQGQVDERSYDAHGEVEDAPQHLPDHGVDEHAVSAAQSDAHAPESSGDANASSGSHTYREMDAAQSLADGALEATHYKSEQDQPRSATADSNIDPSFAGQETGDTTMQEAEGQSQTQPEASMAPASTEGDAQPPTQDGAQNDEEKRDGSADDAAPSAPSTPSKPVLVASRKQNSACDACRSRKVRCNRDPGEEKCQHCKAKGIDCTTLYVQWATSSAKRPSKRARTSIATSEPEADVPKPDSVIEAAEKIQNRLVNYLFRRDIDYPVEEPKAITHANLPYTAPSTSAGAAARSLHQSVSSSVKPAASTGPELQLLTTSTRDEFVSELIETYFSVVHPRLPLLNEETFKKRYYEKSDEVGGANPDVVMAVVLALGAKFSQHTLIQSDREESVRELERAFSSAHGALARGETERAHQVTGAKGGVDLPILTVPDELRRNGRNRLAEDLLIRAVEVLDRVKAHRQATIENIQACILIEALLYQPSTWSKDELSLVGKPAPSSHRAASLQSSGFWYACAARHLLQLGANENETMLNIKDPIVREEVEQAWWTVFGADAASAVMARRRPLIDEEDCNCEPPVPNDANGEEERSASAYRILRSPAGAPARDAAAINRKIADILRKPRHALDGVRIEYFEEVSDLIERWAGEHLEAVGVPPTAWPEEWDYLTGVTACTADISHHALWIVLWECIDELGIYGTDRSAVTSTVAQAHLRRTAEEARTVPDAPDAEAVSVLVAKVQEKAHASALRVASLAAELDERSYLRLDPGMLTQALDATARFLVRFHRPEIDTLLRCFRNLALSYEDAFEKSDRMENIFRVYAERARVDPSFEPGSSLAIALRQDVEREMATTGMDGLSIAAAAIESAAVAQRQEGRVADDTDLKDFSALVALAHQQSQQQAEREQQQREGQGHPQQAEAHGDGSESYVHDDQEMAAHEPQQQQQQQHEEQGGGGEAHQHQQEQQQPMDVQVEDESMQMPAEQTQVDLNLGADEQQQQQPAQASQVGDEEASWTQQ